VPYVQIGDTRGTPLCEAIRTFSSPSRAPRAGIRAVAARKIVEIPEDENRSIKIRANSREFHSALSSWVRFCFGYHIFNRCRHVIIFCIAVILKTR